MTKQEQIEAMAVLGCVRNPQAHAQEECAKCDFMQGMCNAYRHAEALYNAGYRKVFSNKDNFTDLLNEEIKELSLIERTRKETAEEIYDLCCGHGTTFIKKYLKEKYGV